MLFQPSQADVRRFFCHCYGKLVDKAPMDAMEALAAGWIEDHPQYHSELVDVNVAIARDYSAQAQRMNPFLHLSMHLSISEQCSIDQPHGIRQAVELLSARLGSLHEAHHAAMECLAEMLWQSQQTRRPPDAEAYVACVQRRATRI